MEFQITNDDNNGKRKSRIVMPGTPEYEAGLRNIIKPSGKGKTDPKTPSPPTPPKVFASGIVTIDDILKGTPFYSSDLSKGVAIALKQALEYATPEGIIPSMREMIAAKVKADKTTHDFWQRWYTVHTEENIGIDKKGRFYNANEPVLVLVNGGGILTPDRILKAYIDGLIANSARYTDDEWENLLDENVNGDKIKLYPFEEIKNGISNLPHRFGVVMPYNLAQATTSGYYQKREFLENPLVIARNGGLESLSEYFDKAKHSKNNNLGNHHPFNGRDATVPQGRLLFLYSDCYGLSGDYSLNGDRRFVGVAPEAQVAKN